VTLVYDREPRRYAKTREQNLIVRIGKSEAEVTNKRLRSMYCTVEAKYRQTRSILIFAFFLFHKLFLKN